MSEAAFPWAGALLLLGLMAFAAWLRWRPAVGSAGAARWLCGGPASRPAGGDAIRRERLQVVASARLATGGAVQVVRWRDREFVLACQGTSQPLLLDASPVDAVPVRAGS